MTKSYQMFVLQLLYLINIVNSDSDFKIVIIPKGKKFFTRIPTHPVFIFLKSFKVIQPLGSLRKLVFVEYVIFFSKVNFLNLNKYNIVYHNTVCLSKSINKFYRHIKSRYTVIVKAFKVLKSTISKVLNQGSFSIISNNLVICHCCIKCNINLDCQFFKSWL